MPKPIKGASAPAQSVSVAPALDFIDTITMKTTAAAAIVDAAAILSALARVPYDDTQQVGEGCAAGYELQDDTLPNLLKHAGMLIDEVRAITEEIHRQSQGASA